MKVRVRVEGSLERLGAGSSCTNRKGGAVENCRPDVKRRHLVRALRRAGTGYRLRFTTRLQSRRQMSRRADEPVRAYELYCIT